MAIAFEKTYEALLSEMTSVKRVEAMRQEVERLGGALHIYPPNAAGLTLVELTLPSTVTLDTMFPDVPFALV